MKKQATRNRKQGGCMKIIDQKKSEKAFTSSLFIQNSIFLISTS